MRDELRNQLKHHLTEWDDPCQDRGVDWPCDVADALNEFLPPGSLIIVKEDGEWPAWVDEVAQEINRGYAAMTSGRFRIPVSGVLDALAAAQRGDR